MSIENSGNTPNKQWINQQLQIHLKKQKLDAPNDEKIRLLEKRKRSRWWMLGINVAVILFFGYSFFSGITKLSHTLFYILCAVFVINMVLIYYQTKQLSQVLQYLRDKGKN